MKVCLIMKISRFRDIANYSYLKLPMYYIFCDIDGTLLKYVGKRFSSFKLVYSPEFTFFPLQSRSSGRSVKR